MPSKYPRGSIGKKEFIGQKNNSFVHLIGINVLTKVMFAVNGYVYVLMCNYCSLIKNIKQYIHEYFSGNKCVHRLSPLAHKR